MFIPIIPQIEKGLESIQSNQIIDLASGGGGGLLSLNAELEKTQPNLKLILTDFFPNLDAFKYTQSQASEIGFSREKVDARDVPADLKGLRTMFLRFHHFRQADAIQILQNAVNSNQPILIVEGQDRSLPSLLAMFFFTIDSFIHDSIHPSVFNWQNSFHLSDTHCSFVCVVGWIGFFLQNLFGKGNEKPDQPGGAKG